MKEVSAIEVNNLFKMYRLYPDNLSRLKEALHPLRKKYHREFFAVKDVCFSIKKGEIIGIVGKNGSGKSTLLKLICRVIQPTSGDLRIQGKVSALLELGSGFNPDFTGLENIYFYGSIMNHTRRQINRRLKDIIEFADIGEFINQPFKCYSSGMKARLAFSVSVHVDTDILIVDEVLAVGDELFSRKCFAKMEKFAESGKTILLVSHNVNTINEFCDRALFLERGELLLEGETKKVTSQYQKYLYSTPENAERLRRELLEEKRFSKNTSRPENEGVACKKEISLATIKRKASGGNVQEAFFIENFKSQSRVEYSICDIDIFDVHVRTKQGRKVNALVMGQEYLFSYRVKFNEKAENVAFGMAIKTTKGVILGWANAFMKNQYIKKVEKGLHFQVNFGLKCIFMPETYYSNVAVKGRVNGEQVILCRIEDAIAFKVLPPPDLHYGGLVFFNQNKCLIESS